jgi:hypothetical protein
MELIPLSKIKLLIPVAERRIQIALGGHAEFPSMLTPRELREWHSENQNTTHDARAF